MPPWDYVVRRVTFDVETREILEDLRVCESMNVMVHRQLPPGIKGADTWFYYEMGNNTSASEGTDEGAKNISQSTKERVDSESKDKESVIGQDKEVDLNPSSTTSVPCACWESGDGTQETIKGFHFNSKAKVFVPQSNQVAQVANLSSQEVDKEIISSYEQHFAISDNDIPPVDEKRSVYVDRSITDLQSNHEFVDGNGHLIPETIDNVCISQGAHPREVNQFMGYSWEHESKFKCSRKAAEAMAGELLERDSPPLSSEVLQMLNLWKFKSNHYRKTLCRTIGNLFIVTVSVCRCLKLQNVVRSLI